MNTSLPVEFERRMRELLGDEFEAFEKEYENPRQYGLRVNTLKTTAKELQQTAPFSAVRLEPVPGTPAGFRYLKEEIDPGRLPYYQAGLYYLQEPSAMLPAALLGIRPGDRVLDLCAAPGGKSTAAAAALAGDGLLVANDISASRCKALLKNLELFGAGNICVTNAVPARLAEQLPGFFDRILLDAPCSGEGMFRKDAANARAWSLQKVQECAAIQKSLTDVAVSMLRPGGSLLYSTCTFSPEEDEQVIAYLLSEHPEMELCEIPWQEGFTSGRSDLAEGGFPLERCVRLFPHKGGWEGHFLALLHKKEETWGSGRDSSAGSVEAEGGRNDSAGIESGKAPGTGRNDSTGIGRTEFTEDPDREKNRRDREKDRRGGEKNRPDREKGRRGRGRGRGNDPVSSVSVSSGGMRTLEKQELESVSEFLSALSAAPSADLSATVSTDLSAAASADFSAAASWNHSVTEDAFPKERLRMRKDQVFLIPKISLFLEGIPVLRLGLLLGELKKGRFEPSQCLAMHLKMAQAPSVLDLAWDDERVSRYLRGETILTTEGETAEEKGWQLVCVDGYPLGWGRLTGGVLKNKYLAGWRLQ